MFPNISQLFDLYEIMYNTIHELETQRPEITKKLESKRCDLDEIEQIKLAGLYNAIWKTKVQLKSQPVYDSDSDSGELED